MKILLAQKKTKLISAIETILKDIKENECKEVKAVLTTNNIDNIDRKINKEKPDILILGSNFLSALSRKQISYFKSLHPNISMLGLTTDYEQIKMFKKIGIENFILEDTSENFFRNLIKYLKKEIKKRNLI